MQTDDTHIVLEQGNSLTLLLNMTKDNMTVAASGREGIGPSCIYNCTTGTTPSVVALHHENFSWGFLA
jgi:hypothetical protein